MPPANRFLAEIALHTSQLLAVFAANGCDVTSASHRYSSQMASHADMPRMVSLEHLPWVTVDTTASATNSKILSGPTVMLTMQTDNEG